MSARAFAATLVLLLPALAVAEEPPRTISTSGEAVIYVAPDEVIVQVGVETYAAELGRSKAMNDADSQRLLKAVRALEGIEEKHIATAQMEVELRYRDRNQPAAGIEGYLARRTYAITLKNPKLFETLVDTALANGANRLLGFEFRTTELRKHRDEARKLAIRAAREKAVALAGELGCKVGVPRSIGEGASSYYGWSGFYGRGNYLSQNVAQYGPAGDSGGETLPLGQIGVRAQVSVVFDLVPE